MAGHTASVRALLAAGADPKHRAAGQTPITAAAASNQVAVLAPLLAGGAEPFGALAIAASGGKTEVVDWLLAYGVPVTADALAAAAFAGDVALVQRFLGSGVPVDAPDGQGRTALHYAALRGNEAVASLLLVRGASPAARDPAGKTPLDYARDEGWDECAALLEADQHGELGRGNRSE